MSIFQNNSTQIITSDILLNEGGYIGENVTLIFQGGMIKINPNLQLQQPSLTITITGQHTKIIAPITQIFGDSINVDGTWDIDRAYPQWFGATQLEKEQFNNASIWEATWRQITSNNQNPFDGYVIQGISNVHSVDYRGDNIMCRLEGTNQGNSSSQWKKGDILVNMGTTPSIEIINEDEQ